jgi:hypothetical protein
VNDLATAFGVRPAEVPELVVDRFDQWQPTEAESVAIPTQCWGEPPAPVAGRGGIAADRTTSVHPIAG